MADYLMSTGDYLRARKYADDAAQTEAEWAIESSTYVAEGLGDWPRAEQLLRHAGEGYGHPLLWLQWCCRTGHGNLAAAQAQGAAAAAADEKTDDPEKLADAVVYHLLIGEHARAMPLLRRLYTEQGNPWAAPEASLLSAADGDKASRDAALSAVVGHAGERLGVLQDLAKLIQQAFKTGGTLDPQKIELYTTYVMRDANVRFQWSNIYYFAGEFLLLHGETERAITYLKEAAALNCANPTRAMAAQALRSPGIEVPKPGAVHWQYGFGPVM